MRLLYAAILFSLALVTASAIRTASAHEFYEPWCCNGKDCVPYHGPVETTRQGFYLPEFDTLVPYKNGAGIQDYAERAGTRYTVPDGASQYHICVMPWEPTKVRCFYARPGGV